MTTTQPAALPEKIIFSERLAISEAAQVQIDAECCRIIQATLDYIRSNYALAALQPQPAAAVSDERQLLREIVENHAESLQALGDELRQRGVTQISYYGPQAEVAAKSMQLIDRARAILAQGAQGGEG